MNAKEARELTNLAYENELAQEILIIEGIIAQKAKRNGEGYINHEIKHHLFIEVKKYFEDLGYNIYGSPHSHSGYNIQISW